MIRERMIRSVSRSPTAFRWRGGDVSRLEGLSDAVFGFAITLLVVSLEVPQTFSELLGAMRGFLGFAICFALLALVWYEHYIFFRQYGLKDSATVVLNLMLLFVVMFYVYPLKFLFTLLANLSLGIAPLADGRTVIETRQVSSLMVIYGAGYVAVYFLFALLYLNALRQRGTLELNEIEVHDTRARMFSHGLLICIGALSIGFALSGVPALVGFSGPVYFLIGIAMGIFWTFSGRRRRKLELRLMTQHAQQDQACEVSE